MKNIEIDHALMNRKGKEEDIRQILNRGDIF